MRILQLCNKPPFPPVDGGTAAMNSITQGLLSANCSVKVLSFSSEKHPVVASKIPEEYLRKTNFEAVNTNLRVNPFQALFCLLSGESYHIKRFIDKNFENKLIETLKKSTFDIIHLESLYLTPYVDTIRKYSNGKIILRAHNIEHLIWKRIAKTEKNPLKSKYLKHLSLTLREYELKHLNHYDGIVCISPNDKLFFEQAGYRKPIITIPFGIELQQTPNNFPIEKNSLYHLASMDWMPNVESIEWFMEKIWPSVKEKIPQVKLYLAGRKMPEKFFKYQEKDANVFISGEIDNISHFIQSKQINIVPLLSGSGIRIKILEAMSMKKVVISTTVGAEGIQYTNGENLLIADTPEDFVSQIEKCINNHSLCDTLGENAYQLIKEKYSIEKLTEKLLDFYKSL